YPGPGTAPGSWAAGRRAARRPPRRACPGGCASPSRFRRAAPCRTRRARGRAVLAQVRAKGRAHVRCQFGARLLAREVDADRGWRATAERLAHRGRELEAQEMHRGSLLLGLALEVLVGDRVDALAALDLDPDAPLDALQLGEPALALFRIRVLDQ